MENLIPSYQEMLVFLYTTKTTRRDNTTLICSDKIIRLLPTVLGKAHMQNEMMI